MPYLVLPLVALAWTAPPCALAAGSLEPFGSLIAEAWTMMEDAYQRAPTLVLALSALVVLPAVALVSLAAHAGRRRRDRQAALRAAERRAQAVDLTKEELPETASLPQPLQAWLTVEGGDTMALAGQTIRIGRHEDNDIRLTDRSVHRHHAVIERTADEAFVITDMSGKDGNGVRVNGKHTTQARLADGDVIELGRARLRFENAPV